MKIDISQQLKDWRSKKAQEEGVELYVVLHNKTIEELAEKLPSNQEEFQAIKGLGGKKFEKYGQEILSIIKQDLTKEVSQENPQKESVFSVSNYLNFINTKIGGSKADVQGEVSSIDFRERYLFFTIKDSEDESCMSCFMWSSDYELCGFNLDEGLEIIIHGTPEIYKKNGRFSFRVDAFELVGEGALKKAYDELKKKLASEGLFAMERKKSIPAFPTKIGLITSKEGAVIHDFQSNLGRYGYKIKLYNSRVEGMLAVKELISAVRFFKDKDIDVLVVIRGGGSLESLQAFNNEALVREISDYPVPVFCGIGHDKDMPLFSLASDRAVSTPSIVAAEINKTWDQAVEKIRFNESNILHKFTAVLASNKDKINNLSFGLNKFYQRIFNKVSSVNQIISNILTNFNNALNSTNSRVNLIAKNLKEGFVSDISEANKIISNSVRYLKQNDPNRLLSLGYSITFSNGKVLKSVDQVSKNDILISRLSDGKITSVADKIEKRQNGEN